MGFRDLTTAETAAFLDTERVIRIAFHTTAEHYLLPVFYTWFEGALCGLTTPGRKTRLAHENPSVAFQVDSTATTGPWAWSSVSGEGVFETVASRAEFGPFAMQLQQRLSDSPAWARDMLQQRFATLGMVAWRIRPTALSGRAHEQ